MDRPFHLLFISLLFSACVSTQEKAARICSGEVKVCIQDLQTLEDFSKSAKQICAGNPNHYCSIAALYAKGSAGEGYTDFWANVDLQICEYGRQGVYQDELRIAYAGVACMSRAEKYILDQDPVSAMTFLRFACERGSVPGACKMMGQMDGRPLDSPKPGLPNQLAIQQYLNHLAVAGQRGASHVMVDPSVLNQCRMLAQGEYLCPQAVLCPIGAMRGFLEKALHEQMATQFTEVLKFCETIKTFVFQTERNSGPADADIALRRGEDRQIPDAVGLPQTFETWIDLGAFGS